MNMDLKLSQFKEIQGATLNNVRDLHNDGVSGNKDKVYDLTDLENKLHVSRRTLAKWKSEGRMIFSQIGKKIFVTPAELERFLETNKQG